MYITLPIIIGIFTGITPRTAKEATEEGKIDIAPYLSTLKVDDELNPKYPGGIETQQIH